VHGTAREPTPELHIHHRGKVILGETDPQHDIVQNGTHPPVVSVLWVDN